MADDDVVFESRVVGLVCRPESKAHSKMCHEMRSAWDTKQYFSGWADCSWMEQMKETIENMHDFDSFYRMGFTVNFDSDDIRDMDIDNPKVKLEDSMAASILRMKVHLFAERGSSMQWHSSYWPGQLAALLDLNLRAEYMEKFKKAVLVFEAAKKAELVLQELSNELNLESNLAHLDFPSILTFCIPLSY